MQNVFNHRPEKPISEQSRLQSRCAIRHFGIVFIPLNVAAKWNGNNNRTATLEAALPSETGNT